MDAVRVRHLPHEPRFPDARLADDRHHLAMPGGGPLERLAQLLQLGVPPDEARQAARGGRGQPGAAGSGPDQLVDLDRGVQTLHGHRPQRHDLDIPLREPQRVGGEEASPACRELFHPGRQVRGLADRGVVHVEIAADGPDHDLARVQPDADLERDAVGATHLLGIPAHGGLHVERGIARPHGVVLVGERRAEERHDPVAHDLVDRALVAVDGLHHPLEHRVEELPRLLGVAVGEQLHRALQVGEEHGDLLALAFEGGLRGEDLLGEVLGGVGLGEVRSGRLHEAAPGPPPRARRTCRRRRTPRGFAEAAGGAQDREPRAAAPAERHRGRILEGAARTGHAPRSLVCSAPSAPARSVMPISRYIAVAVVRCCSA